MGRGYIYIYKILFIFKFAKISPHLKTLWRAPHVRYTYASEYYKQTKDIETLRRILAHSDISTTTIYITLANIDVENGMKAFKIIA
jgi:site-specific recombinase XerD